MLEDDVSLVDDVRRSREDWLLSALDALRPAFESHGFSLATAIRVACGFPSTARRSGTLGETWADTQSRDRTVEILISPVLDNPVEVLSVLIAQLAHATPGGLSKGTAYQTAVLAMGLEPLRADFKALRGADGFAERYASMLEGLGPYPHAALVPTNLGKKQATRMLKAVCACGYTIRLTQKWADRGLPTCVCGDVFNRA